MNDDVRCPQCGARNGAAAEWCTQCYARLDEPAVPPPPPPDGTPPPGAPPSPPPPPAGSPSPGAAASGTDGSFRQADDGLEWRCGVCQEWNTIERVTCSVCSTPFGRTLGGEERPPRPEVPAGLLVGGSLVLPGLGHWLLGLRGAGVLRAILGLVWGVGGVTLFVQARASGQSVLPAIPLLLGWAFVAGGSANDAFVEGGGRGQQVLSGRMLLWVTIGVVGGTFAAVLVSVLSAVGG